MENCPLLGDSGHIVLHISHLEALSTKSEAIQCEKNEKKEITAVLKNYFASRFPLNTTAPRPKRTCEYLHRKSFR